MKVTMLSRFFDHRTAGLSRVANTLCAGFAAQDIWVVKVAASGPGLSDYFKYLMWEIPSYAFPREKTEDVFHAITPMEAIWTPRDKTVVTVHDLIMLKHPEFGGSGVGSSWIRQTLASMFAIWGYGRGLRARYLVCTTEETKADLISHRIPEERIRVIKLGIGEEFEPHPVPHDTFRIGYLGQLDRRKRVHLLIEFFKALPDKDVRLWIGGTGTEEGRLKSLAEGDSRITFHGRIPDMALPAFYNSLDAFAWPTAIEGYGLPAVEAMACRVPVFSWADAIIPADIKHRCINIKALPDFIRGTCKADRYYLENNYRFAKSHRWADCIDGYVKLFKEISGK